MTGSDTARGVRERRPRTLGLVAFCLAVLSVVVGCVMQYVAGVMLGGIGQYVDVKALIAAGTQIDVSSLPAAGARLVDTANVVSVVGIAVWIVPAAWGFVQGIVATVRRRGRAWGVVAIVVAVLGYVLMQVAHTAGLGIGLSPYLS